MLLLIRRCGPRENVRIFGSSVVLPINIRLKCPNFPSLAPSVLMIWLQILFGAVARTNRKRSRVHTNCGVFVFSGCATLSFALCHLLCRYL